MKKKYFIELSARIGEKLKNIKICWEGKKAIEEMKKNQSPHWKQMEWIGFYFEFLCQNKLKDIFEFGKIKYNKVSFDGFNKIPWDFKAHATNTSSHNIIINDKQAIINGIKEYGLVGIIIAIGDVIYNDEKRTFQEWHDELKGEESKYVKDRKSRGAWSRLRKTRFDLKQICFLGITQPLLEKTGSFQEDFRNATGSKRKAKILLNLEKIDKKKNFIFFLDY